MLLTTVNKEYDDYDYDRDYKYDDDSITGDALWSLPLRVQQHQRRGLIRILKPVQVLLLTVSISLILIRILKSVPLLVSTESALGGFLHVRLDATRIHPVFATVAKQPK